MDVTIETNKGKSFQVEIGFFDTVREIKEKVEKYHGVPVAKQSLYIHGAAMEDERDTEYYEVLQGSKIQLVVEPDEGEKEENEDEEREEGDQGERKKKRSRLSILINVPATKRRVAVEVEGNETVGWLKEMIASEGLAAGRVALVVGGLEMQEQQRTLEECGVGDGTEVSVVARAAPTASGGGAKRMTVMVLPKGGTKKIGVEVNVMENVREMRKELERMQSMQLLQLPPEGEGYFFIYKQQVMEEDNSFRWHGVRPNDTIEIWGGSVTGGSL